MNIDRHIFSHLWVGLTSVGLGLDHLVLQLANQHCLFLGKDSIILSAFA